MNYIRKIEYKIVPKDSFPMIRNCSGCGGKSQFINTNSFRVNANGNRLDVWLIYQCASCKHTANLTIYERLRPDSIPRDVYQGFLENKKELAFRYGTDSHFFSKNKVEIEWSEVRYELQPIEDLKMPKMHTINANSRYSVSNPYAIKVRAEKIISELLQCSRSELKNMMKVGQIIVTERKEEHLILVEIADSYQSKVLS